MRKIAYAVFLILFMPLIVNAKVVFNICETCEYTNVDDVLDIIHSNITKENSIFQINEDTNTYEAVEVNFLDNREYEISTRNANYGSSWASIEKIEINGFDSNRTKIHVNSGIFLVGLNLKINDIEAISDNSIGFAVGNFFPQYILIDEMCSLEINNVKVDSGIGFLLNNVNVNIKNLDTNILSIQTGNQDIGISGASNTSIIDSKITKIVNASTGTSNGTINVYSSDVKVDKYISMPLEELEDFLEYDIMDIYGEEATANTYVHFEEKRTLKPGENLNFLEIFKNLNQDKNISYSIDNKKVAKIESNTVTALKDGTTNVIGTTDEGHIIYTIRLTVEKESLPEKIDKMTIKVPITGSKIKAWVVVVSVILLAVIGTCSYMLIRRKK